MTSKGERGADREHDQLEEVEDVAAEAWAEGLGALHRAKGGRRVLRDGGGQSLGSLLFAWTDVGVQVVRRMVTLGAELGDGAFGRAFGGAGGQTDDVAVGKPVRAVFDGCVARGGFMLENRRSGHADVRFPSVVEFHAAKGNDRQLIELRFEPEAPIVCADANAKIEVSFATDKFTPGERYIGWVAIETARGGKCSLAIEYKHPSDQGGADQVKPTGAQ